MILTEDEAKDKWCPFARVGEIVEHHCIGSKCAAWRWHTEYESSSLGRIPLSEKKITNNKGDSPVPPEGDGWEKYSVGLTRTAWVRRMTPTMGYCGLAGKPE